MLKKSKCLGSLDSRSSSLGSQANHAKEKALDIVDTISIPNDIVDIQDNNVICNLMDVINRQQMKLN
jgi:hypothetical protein